MRFIASAVVLGCLSLAPVASAAGGGGARMQVFTVDPTGAVFTCPTANYTVLGGTLRFLVGETVAANGSEHLTSKKLPGDVALSDGTTDTIYRLVGANSAGGSIDVVRGTFEFTDATHFNIVAPGGGVVGKVAGIQHVTSTGEGFSLTFGDCEAP
jgi:hypothetical protein